MRTTRLQAKPDLASAVKHQPPPAHTTPVSPWSMQSSGGGPIVQRKCARGKCARGGDCPRCAAETEKLNVQTKPAISSPGDVFEREADAVADHVMRMPDPASQRQSTNAATDHQSLIQRQTNGATANSTVASDFISRLGAGAPLDSASRKLLAHELAHVAQ